jgi:pimeloyl-ACP methyl ester carboxylesterase
MRARSASRPTSMVQAYGVREPATPETGDSTGATELEERLRIAAMTCAARGTIVLIHGLWLTARSWEKWIDLYERLGHRVLAPSWPGMEADVEALNADPSPIASLTVEQVVDHYESIVIELERPPIVMGHSIGGTFAQILLDRGLGAAGVGVASATAERAGDIPLTTIKVASPALSQFSKGEAVHLTTQEFHYAFANTLSRKESDTLYARYAVPAPGGLLREHAFARFLRDASSTSAIHRERRAPLLFIGLGEDHVVPPRLVRPDDETHDDASSITDFIEFPGRPHFPGALGWEDVADYALAWAVEHGLQSTAHPDAVDAHRVKGGSS